ncbi:MAG TPA: carboxypeptidase regulatory-like domain-containing protein [Bacteroidota bacterium]|jgi:hypothetical protein|nr:carboxypeptidase regulatory-like domain-containing protein [Bacteroidota bacterium]
MKFASLLIASGSLLCSLSPAATIRGRVLDSRSSASVAGAAVLIFGTATETRTDANGVFVLENISAGAYGLRASCKGFEHKEFPVTIDSASQTFEITVLLTPGGRTLAPGCAPELASYQVDLAGYLAKNPGSVTVQVKNFQEVDSVGSVEVEFTNSTSVDLYIEKDRRGAQMYIQKLADVSMTPVKAAQWPDPFGGVQHELSDVVRIPQHQTVTVDTVKLRQYDFRHLRPGDYKVQMVYVFPQSRKGAEDSQYRLASPVLDEASVGELYCMTLQGRFASNWLTVHVK